MVGRISRNGSIGSNVTFDEDQGVTLTASRGPNNTAHTQGARSGPAGGTVRDEVVTPQQLQQTERQAAITATNNTIRNNARTLLAQAEGYRPGPRIQVAPERTSNFQQLVDRQHDRAFREGGANTAATVIGLGVGGAIAHGLPGHAASATVSEGTNTAAQRAAEITFDHMGHHLGREAFAAGASATSTEGPHLWHLAHHPTASGAASVLRNGATHAVADFAAGAALGGPGSMAVAGVAVLAQSMDHIAADVEERRQFQQQASVYDRTRNDAIRHQRENTAVGATDGRFAAAGRGTINWELYQRDGDYAAGVRQGLREAASNPADVAGLRLGPKVDIRRDVPWPQR